MDNFLRKNMSRLALAIAHPYSLVIAVCVSVAWIIYGGIKDFPQSWINLTTIVLGFSTLFAVFIVQFAEETDTDALQNKMDAVIEADKKIDQSVIGKEKIFDGKI